MPNNTTAPGPTQLLDQQLCFALHSASLVMTRVYQPQLEALGLTYPQYLVMLVLWERDGLSVSELGARLFLDSGTLTPLLKRLEAAALLDRSRDRADERRVVIRLTDAGHQLKARAASVPGCVFAATQCSLDQITELTRQLKQLRERLTT